MKHYTIAVNDTRRVQFESNPDAGYWWHWVNRSSNSIVDSINVHSQVDKDEFHMVGSPGGVETWNFIGRKKGKENVIMEYSENDKKVFEIEVR